MIFLPQNEKRIAEKGGHGTVLGCTGRKEGRGLSHSHHISCQRGTVTSRTGRKEGRGLSYRHHIRCQRGTVTSRTGRKEGRGLSYRHHISCQRGTVDQSHGAKGGEGPFVSTPAHITVMAVQRRITMDNRKSPTPLIHRQTGKPLFIVNASTPLGPVKTSHRVSKKANSTSKTIERFPVPQKPTAW
jgi:hypothetical protein